MGYVKSKAHNRPTPLWKFVVLFFAVVVIIATTMFVFLSWNHGTQDSVRSDTIATSENRDKFDTLDSDINRKSSQIQIYRASKDTTITSISNRIQRESRMIPEVKPDLKPRETPQGQRISRRKAAISAYPRYKAPTTNRFCHSGSWEDGDFKLTSFLGINFSSNELLPNEETISFFSPGPDRVCKQSRFRLDNNSYGFEEVILRRSYETETLGAIKFTTEFDGNPAPSEKALDILDKITKSMMEEYNLPEPTFDYYKNENNVEYYTYKYEQAPIYITYSTMVQPDGTSHYVSLTIENGKNQYLVQEESKEAIENPTTIEVRNWLAQPLKRQTVWPRDMIR